MKQKKIDTIFDIDSPTGTNFEIAAFRWWSPGEAQSLKGVVVLVPGSNCDGRSHVEDAFWQNFARCYNLALIGCWFKDNPHKDMQIEGYAHAGDGSGQALLDAVEYLAEKAEHPEVTTTPLLLWGHSAGGQFNYEFACWKPERVQAFVVNKGGYYFTDLAPAATRNVPGIFFIGGKDENFRIQNINNIFNINHKAGSVWNLVIRADEKHEVGKTQELAAEFFADVLTNK